MQLIANYNLIAYICDNNQYMALNFYNIPNPPNLPSHEHMATHRFQLLFT